MILLFLYRNPAVHLFVSAITTGSRYSHSTEPSVFLVGNRVLWGSTAEVQNCF